MSHGLRQHLSSATSRLTITYLAIIMAMSIGFSIVFYHTSSNQLGHQLPPPRVYYSANGTIIRQDIDDFLSQRVNEGRHELLVRLLILNCVTLAGGAVLSYYLARRTMEPIEASVEAQSQFVSDASHELRTPLTAIQASNEVALRKPKLNLSEAKNVIRQNTQDVIKLQTIANGLLQLAKGEVTRPELKIIGIKSVVDEVINQLKPAAADKKIELQNKLPDQQALADHSRLAQVITILLDNAIRYSPAKTVVTVDGGIEGQQYILNVRDQGAGISAKDLPHIFQRFYQASSSRTKNKKAGYGLGLSIAEQLMRQQQAEISATSQVGKGSVFSLRLRTG